MSHDSFKENARALIENKFKKLSINNILNSNISGIYTWPYLPRGLVSKSEKSDVMDKNSEEHKNQFFQIEQALRTLSERQRVIVSWLLVVSAGILGNLIVNLFFGSPNFYFSSSSGALLIIGITLLLGSIYLIFRYYPTNLSYQIRFLPPWEYPPDFYPTFNMDELSSLAKIHVSSKSSFHNIIVKFSNLIALAILRDQLNSVDMKILKVSELDWIGRPFHPFYSITLDFKSSKSFWSPSIGKKVKAELIKINDAILIAKKSIKDRAVEHSESEWIQRGHNFLNEISQWETDNLIETIQTKITS
ncbi:MAG: hypothetical protein JSV20_06825 [Candidatus Bathyarchaeota archaeon]|nr:MAG: hypothetical protein JSV20_06825 [Candidatus Bathyarchaeota archaeon]